jgi:hypothetical protein
LRATVPSASANASSKEEVEKAAAQAAAFVQLSKSDLLRHSAFLDLVDEVTRNGLHAGRFEVPRRTVDGFRTNARSVTVFDDHSRSWFDLGGGQTTAPRIVDATIWATVTPQTGQAQTYGIESTSSKVTPTGRRFEFPSLDALAAIPNSTMALTTTVRTYREFSRWRRPDASYLRQSFTAHRVEMQSKSKEAGYTMRVSVSQAAPDKNGELLIPMELKSAAPMEVVVQTDGGVIALPDPKAAEYTIQGAERIFKTNGIYSLRVAGGVANSWLEVKTFKVDGSERIAGPTARVWILAGAPSTAAKPTP